MGDIPLSLYIHFPWCIKKCPYCDFNSHTISNELPAELYINTLISDFVQEYSYANGRKIETVFLGGGTPSLFHAKDIEPLFTAILPFCIKNVEITLEANPGTIERGQFKDYFGLGINRISLGVQSLNTKYLQKLGRIHTKDEVASAVTEITAAGFERFNLDLMHGLPQQTAEEALADMEQALAFNPSHLSWYQLTIEPNTYFAAYPPKLPNDETLADIEEAGFALLANHGYARYEISAFAHHQDYCRHNLNYWNFGDYLGIGAGAHGKLTGRHGEIVRTSKPKLPKSYLHCDLAANRHEKTVTTGELPFEFMMNTLRLPQGFAKPLFYKRTGLTLESITAELEAAKTRGLLTETATHIKPSETGLQFLNELLNLFL